MRKHRAGSSSPLADVFMAGNAYELYEIFEITGNRKEIFAAK
jgi:hypothetical protein